MKAVTITYGRWRWCEEDEIVATSCQDRIYDPDYIQYGQIEVEVEVPTKQEQDHTEISNLRKKLAKTRAVSQREIERLEDQIQQLMALE